MTKARGYTDAQRATDYKTIFGTPTGQKVLADILTHAGVYGLLAPNGDGLSMAFKLGERNTAVRIATYVGRTADAFISDALTDEETIAND